MKELLLDSTWSYKLGAAVFIKGRENPIMCIPANMHPYKDEDIKREFVELLTSVETALEAGKGTLYIGRQAFNAAEIQAVSYKLNLLNELRDGSRRNDFENYLLDELMAYYVTKRDGADYD